MPVIDIGRLEQIQKELELALPKDIRPWSRSVELEKLRGALLTGPRGVGKTTCLINAAQKRGKALYFSADHPIISLGTLSDFAEEAFARGYDGVIIDEVHCARDWSKHLKALYDSHPRKFIWATDSSSLVLRMGTADLSRRFPRQSMPLLSFREFLFLNNLGEFNPWSLSTIDAITARKIVPRVKPLSLFPEHISCGMRPFFCEGEYTQRLLATLEKSIYHDTPYFVPQSQEQHLRLMNAVVALLATAAVPTLNIESLCRDWGLGKEKLYALLDVLEHLGVINIVRHLSDAKATGKGAKIFLTDPSLYDALGGSKGNAREAYVVSMCRAARLKVHAPKDDSEGDLIIDGELFEVGGRDKKKKKAQRIIRDDAEFPTKSVVPLWMIGFLY
jgi:predicted AAA+ superfamily ATPase